ncbi:uncharacterized protein LOC135129805 [Zophobas morio]|uniref:uncharacterized protein LOC135129805 n=1 Tax=Zophobas morio TaxID=2755281 RepID=UPI003083C6CF
MNVFVLLGAVPEDGIPTPPKGPEDQQVINDTITKYGRPQNYKALGLPGPELVTAWNTRTIFNERGGESGVYTLKVRTKTENFSYNGLYEVSTLKVMEGRESMITKGQFGEHFERKSGGYYIRIIGYTLDKKGYRQFLINLFTARTDNEIVELPIIRTSVRPKSTTPGPRGTGTIPTDALLSLVG